MHKRRTAWRIAGTLIPAFLFSGTAFATTDCHELDPWLRARESLATLVRSPRETAEALETATSYELAARTRVSKRIFAEYLAGSAVADRLDACLAQVDDGGNFLFTLQDTFFSESISRLRASRSPTLQKLISLLDRQLAAGLAPSFRLTGTQFSPDDPGPWQAGFHRGAGSIYADFRKIPANEWLLIFTHEMIHGLDENLSASMSTYNDPARVARLSSGKADPRDLEGWLEAGLGRGLWAEYRAWVPSLVIYREGLREGLWKNIAWLDVVLAQKPANMPFDRFVYLYLDQNSPDPVDGLFAQTLFSSSLASLRTRYRSENLLPDPGNLGPLGFETRKP